MHGAGNDFILIRHEEAIGANLSALAKKMCHRRFGIGADGLMASFPSEIADVRMEYYNSDGSLAEMCGNGIRCFARFVYDAGLVQGTAFSVETGAGVKTVELSAAEDEFKVGVGMGAPITGASDVPAQVDADRVWGHPMVAAGSIYPIYSIRMGVPHTVIFTDRLENELTETAGPEIEGSEMFPEKTNVNFVQILSRGSMLVDTWERGAGHTLACGTGVCASVWIAHALDLVDAVVHVQTPGGELTIRLIDGEVFMEGRAELICRGEYLG